VSKSKNSRGEDDAYIVLVAKELLFYLVNEYIYIVGGSLCWRGDPIGSDSGIVSDPG
jgi:hypothetical protein